MGIDKSRLMKLFQKDPDRYWKVSLFEDGWNRKKCPKCGKMFWTLDPDKELCGDPPCGEYEFLGKPPTKKKLDYIQTWKTIEKFFSDEGHTPIKRYPVICRWFPGLYFTVASIVDFQRSAGGKTVFELPTNPLIVPQVCLRFNDIPNIGVSGRHMSSFTMVGQHAISGEKGGYWKDRCVDLDHRFLTEALGIPEEKVVWTEDIWAGPNAFGSSLEYFVDGLELGNAVFTEFVGTVDKYETMDQKIIDMGAGHERFTWLSQGTPTAYDAVYGPVMEKLRKTTGVKYNEKKFLEYARLAGSINADEHDIVKSKAAVAKTMGMAPKDLAEFLAPMEALYAIADHARTLAFAISDSGLPSNVGGGYNLRVIARRAMGLNEKFGFGLDLPEVCAWHADYLKPLFPELAEHKEQYKEILGVEKTKYVQTMHRARRTVSGLLDSKKPIGMKKMQELYESHGITPELIKDIAEKSGNKFEVPPDFYTRMTEQHMKREETDAEVVDVREFPVTKKLFYGPKLKFKAKVIGNKRIDNKDWVVLDQSAFYAESGGQDHDTGYINGERVNNVQIVGGVVLHQVDKRLTGEAKCEVDPERRKQLTQHHTAAHLVNGAARRVLGEHVWQAGAQKGVSKAHLDITHYEAPSPEQVQEMEDLANKVIAEGRTIHKALVPRAEAEREYGFRLYQGGAVPEKELRIISIPEWDTEACGGTHADNTGEVDKIVITSTEKIQDGVIRVWFRAGRAADAYLSEMDSMLEDTAQLLMVNKKDVPKAVTKLVAGWKAKRKRVEELRRKQAKTKIKEMQFRALKKYRVLISKVDDANMDYLRDISKQLCDDRTFLFLIGVKDQIYVFSFTGKEFLAEGVNSGVIVKELCKKLGGAGGGPPHKGEGVIPLSQKEAIDRLLEDVNKRVEANLK
ncbi:alanine--tRNA ligase [archaeon]